MKDLTGVTDTYFSKSCPKSRGSTLAALIIFFDTSKLKEKLCIKLSISFNPLLSSRQLTLTKETSLLVDGVNSMRMVGTERNL